ncbi:ATP-dependent Clp protease, ATP-binding subunit [Streptococcus infantarius subsp. infantarius]|jgi:ATP-dependent Clp protease ATP-binding subunit ClpE|uniref:ATP-dependent Clp protease ATP-binding subunit n=1 Tax=Streptococcus infantarius TaxID=102684 RepID=UPI001BD9D384|nr:ATP-dependent Clp protease ATP-binding subunit [Streptococcus infantarius]MBT0896384.1 AAA family ATPase [Streptococcus infantarius subsp. infantarius]MBT0900288.1 AAA family ATPase [Streptococcus infantarius subsp. infantarius]MBT1033925.1 AAA family ATPase [Streptococcus infantarius subsp. infantarius]MCO4562314.1 ATP-dependent Clp protease, ATP-binding subunit [Streptococcus infantarius subsp. infantarius]MCO4584895.1 ATP-dependent Clp protease, ATP-binding subunit [Streptococcus infanta
MLCQNCHLNESTIHLYTNVNGQQKQIDLCQNCYQIMKTDQNNTILGGLGGNSQSSSNQTNQSSNPFDDFFSHLSDFPAFESQGFQNTPPTQSGGGNNNGRGGNGNNNFRPNGPAQQEPKGLLEEFGINVTDIARRGDIDPVIGRDAEIVRVIEILNRRTKNNPVLIGEPGVGKTAVVEGLAQKIVDGNVPQKLQNKQVIRLDVVSLVQGTGIRGQFEERMQKLMEEIRERKDVILFIDEIHEIVGAGNAGDGNMDAGNILKPALARGELQLVGATTLNEYRIIEKDAALERRMQPVKVDEPSVEETITILRGIQKKYEDYHHVKYSDDAIEAAATLSNRYIQDRFLPDKAIDLLDEAGSKMNLTLNFVDPKEIEKRLVQAENLKTQATREEDYERAAYFRDQIAKYKEMQKQTINEDDIPVITEKTIEAIVEEKTNIPVGDLKEKEQSQLIHLADDLKEHVIGQDEAVDKIAKAIRRNRVGLGTPNRPIGSFLFVGPTGVGKTELSKQLAIELFGSADSMIRFDMSEYMEKHAVAKLVGAPPGYVGYEEAGQLTEKVRRNPYSLILLDEVEKAHPDVMHMFLQVLDDGRLTDGQGRTVSFKDTIIIMTSNAGTGKSEASVGFGAAREGRTNSVLGQLGDFFSPEFMNRFDGIIEFKALSKDNLLHIVNLMLDDVNNRLATNDIHLEVTDRVKEKLVDLGYDSKMGARPLRRTIQDHIEDAITDFYLEHPTEKDLKAVLTSNGKIIIKSAKKIEKEETVSVE